MQKHQTAVSDIVGFYVKRMVLEISATMLFFQRTLRSIVEMEWGEYISPNL